MPKHLLLGETVRHVTGSAEVISPLNRFGHSVSCNTLLNLRLYSGKHHSPQSKPSFSYRQRQRHQSTPSVLGQLWPERGNTIRITTQSPHIVQQDVSCQSHEPPAESPPKWSLNTSKNSCPWATGTELNSPFCCLSADTKYKSFWSSVALLCAFKYRYPINRGVLGLGCVTARKI